MITVHLGRDAQARDDWRAGLARFQGNALRGSPGGDSGDSGAMLSDRPAGKDFLEQSSWSV